MEETALAAELCICGDILQNFQKTNATVLKCCYTFKINYKKNDPTKGK